MRKRVITPGSPERSTDEADWLDLEQISLVEVSSEDAEHPIEAALISGDGRGWRAAEPGEQTIRLLFDSPQRVRRIRVRFDDQTGTSRTQQFTLRWLPDGQQHYQEIVRQQYNFSPPDATSEVEEYSVQLNAVAAVELVIQPDISGGSTHASLSQLRLA